MAAEQYGMDLSSLGQYSAGGSPKQMYTYFLLTAEKDFFVGVKSSDYEKLEDCTLTLIALLPDEEAQKRLTTSYFKMRDEGKPIRQAAILTLGQITIYLNAALEFTEVATGALI